METSPYEQNILEWDVNNRQTNKENYKWLYINAIFLKSLIGMHVEPRGEIILIFEFHNKLATVS